MKRPDADSVTADAGRRRLPSIKLRHSLGLHAALVLSLPLLAITVCSSAATRTLAAATKSTTYTCKDGRIVKAAYPDPDTAVITLNGQTHRLHATVSADGARYVDDRWQWWAKGMHQAQLAPLKPGETIASDSGVACTAS